MWLEYLRIAQKVLRTHKFRSILTVLSITIGAFSIVLMSSLAQSGLTTLVKNIEEIGGARLIFVSPKKPQRMERKAASYTSGITLADRDLLYQALPHVVTHATYAQRNRRDLIGDTGETARADVLAGDAAVLDIFKMKLANGRTFSEDENRGHHKVCVVGHKTAQQLFDSNALGHWVTLPQEMVRCRVIGQLADQDRWMDFEFSWDDLVVVPLDAYADADANAIRSANVMLMTDDKSSNESVKRIANALLSERHHGVDDFEIFDFARIMNKFDQVFSVMRAIVGFVAGIALLVGGVGVMNMMLVSVSERVREIGIRKAIGASPRDIAAQFLWEAMVLSGSGGLVGILGGVAAAMATVPLIKHFKPGWVGVIDHRATMVALVVSVAIGLIFGFFPARRAGKLDAIQAIRR
jgi:putative ABC transport system permease protein